MASQGRWWRSSWVFSLGFRDSIYIHTHRDTASGMMTGPGIQAPNTSPGQSRSWRALHLTHRFIVGKLLGQQQSPQYLPGRKRRHYDKYRLGKEKGVHEERKCLLFLSLLWKHSGVRKRLARILTPAYLVLVVESQELILGAVSYVIWPRHSSALISALAHKPTDGWQDTVCQRYKY